MYKIKSNCTCGRPTVSASSVSVDSNNCRKKIQEVPKSKALICRGPRPKMNQCELIYVQTFFLVIIPQKCSIITIHMVFTLYYVL